MSINILRYLTLKKIFASRQLRSKYVFLRSVHAIVMYSTCSQCGRLVTGPETKYCSDECEEKAK